MAVILTENIILSRTRSHDLKDVRKLNCWNFELTDVSMVRRMPSVQVLSLSLNKIKTLADFAYCPQLEELYLRKNEIADINELHYLTLLPKLRKLWLAENPCAEAPNYRHTVLKALPDLEILDNVPVQDDEIRRADELGDEVYDPLEEKSHIDQVETESVLENDDHVFVENDNETEHSSSEFEHLNRSQLTSKSSGSKAKLAYTYSNQSDNEMNAHNVTYSESSGGNTSKMQKQRFNYQSNDGEWSTSSSKETPRSAGIGGAHVHHHNQHNGNNSTPKSASHAHQSMLRSSSINEYSHQNLPAAHNGQNRNSISNYDHIPPGQYENIQQNGNKFSSSNTSLNTNNSAGTGIQQQKILLSKGGKNRNANLLSAVLCLIKELDFASLEVVETAIHCRMEELEEL